MHKRYEFKNQEGRTVIEHIPSKGVVRCIETTHESWSFGETVSDRNDGSDGCEWVDLSSWEALD